MVNCLKRQRSKEQLSSLKTIILEIGYPCFEEKSKKVKGVERLKSKKIT